jgi:hypothetical protein
LIFTAIQNPEGLAGTPRLLKQRRADAAVRKQARKLEQSQGGESANGSETTEVNV